LFSGHFVLDHTPPSAAPATIGAPLAASAQQAEVTAAGKLKPSAETGPPSAPKFHISGQAIIGRTNELEINAETVGP
jgi:hypothetical protein